MEIQKLIDWLDSEKYFDISDAKLLIQVTDTNNQQTLRRIIFSEIVEPDTVNFVTGKYKPMRPVIPVDDEWVSHFKYMTIDDRDV